MLELVSWVRKEIRRPPFQTMRSLSSVPSVSSSFGTVVNSASTQVVSSALAYSRVCPSQWTCRSIMPTLDILVFRWSTQFFGWCTMCAWLMYRWVSASCSTKTPQWACQLRLILSILRIPNHTMKRRTDQSILARFQSTIRRLPTLAIASPNITISARKSTSKRS